MKIFKIGGSVVKSKQEFDNLIQKINFFASKSNQQIFFVFSAFAKTSSKLKQLALLASSNETKIAIQLKDEIISFHLSLIEQADFSILGKFDLDLTNYINGLSITNDLSTSILDKILHIGENLAIELISHTLMKNDVKFYFLDAKSYLITDSNFGEANPIVSKIESKLQNLCSQFESHSIVLTQGFIGFDSNLAPTTMGFESSNLTATLLADALNVKEINIISDVPALLSAEPNYFSNPHVIQQISYSEAKILAKFGLKLLFERMIEIAEKKQIIIRYSDLTQEFSTVISNIANSKNRFVISNFDLMCFKQSDQSIYSFTNGSETYDFVFNQKDYSVSYDYKLITLFGFDKADIIKLYQNTEDIVNINCNESGFAAIVVKELDFYKVIQQIEAILL